VSEEEKAIVGYEAIKKHLQPEWLLECVMYNPKQNAIVVSPARCLKRGVKVLQVAQSWFGSKTILHFRLDYDVRLVKKGAEEA